MRSHCQLHRGLRRHGCFLFFLLMLFILLLTGCSFGSGNASDTSPAAKDSGTRDATPQVLVAEASGEVTYGSDIVSLDASHTADGYLMLRYSGTNEKVKLQITLPDSTEYTYPVTASVDYSVYPLPGGNGSYKVTLLESVSVEDNLYAVSFTQDLDVEISNEFLPFLYPNFYVNFTADSACVKKGEELAHGCSSDLDAITNIYNYVIENISYDQKKADSVPYGYIPSPDDTLSSGTGICFDYASLMSAMLRSQRIPTKLDVGYSGDVYHAWISCYVTEVGWVDNIIEFDGKNWSIMDPTLAANNSASNVKKYVGDGSNYVTKYTY
ncbi:transglutaminase-like domain-containing protein [uncultured Eubacterium sp.]|uniref:transglutaminase-like domain-containing protein n=1 Tax=uncultured Eubacterium sp. TaxID=165185 RepID=UPI0025E7C0A0|nr:transglutaminase-like domain-containing protein [uncultured Eubacterium sp.]